MSKKSVKKAPVFKLVPKPTGYHFPRKLLEQPYFITPEQNARLGLSMLANNEFVSPLGHLLSVLVQEGHDVSACSAEYEAMRELLRDMDSSLDSLHRDIFRLRFSATKPGMRYAK